MLALDLALFLRDNNEWLQLSTSDIGAAFIFAFRIGTNPYSWVKQETLAKEMQIHERKVRDKIRKLQKIGFILVQKDKDDTRCNVYSFTDDFHNYHQMSTDEKKKCSEKYRTKTAGILLDTGRKRPVYTGRKRPVLNCTNGTQPIENKEEKQDGNTTKRKYKEHIKDKRKENEVVDNFVLPTWLDKELWSQFEQHRVDMKEPMSNQAKKLLITKLDAMRKKGIDIKQQIEEAIISRWKSVYEPKQQNKTKFDQPKQITVLYDQQCKGCWLPEENCQCVEITRSDPTVARNEIADIMSRHGLRNKIINR